MKHLLTISALLISSLAMGQWPSLPYNPDDNADGLIGVADLQALLANYGSEFASAVVSEDGESAIVYMGDMGYPQCKYSCDHLPGFWRLPNLEDLVPVWTEVYNGGAPMTWLYSGKESLISTSPSSQAVFPVFRGSSSSTNTYVAGTDANFAVTQNVRCYCAAKQLPRVEYEVCTSYSGNNVTQSVYELGAYCVNPKLAEGWMLKGDVHCDGNRCFQTLWRWAE